jgi:phosphatidate phosphatase APP1
MSDWKAKMAGLVNGIDQFSDRWRIRWRALKGYDEPLMIVPYLGYGTAENLLLKGRVVQFKDEIVASRDDGRRRNLKNFFRRFATDEVPYARVRATFQNAEAETTADDEGYFTFEIRAALDPAGDARFREIDLELLEPVAKSGERARAVGRVLVPPATARFGVISDLDDTVITTDVTSKIKMLVNTALRNEYTRMPFKGVAAFYQALQKGAGGAENNPIFYVSSSPWNLYPFLTEFLRLNDIPLGPLFLKDFGNHTIFHGGDHAGHKTENIERILRTFPHLPFLLIGDSGEKDPEIYREILGKFPEQIKVIYIRSVNQEPERLAAIDRLAGEIAPTGCQLVLAPDTEFAAAHAAAAGYIDSAELPKIREEKIADQNAPTLRELEAAPGDEPSGKKK